MGGKKSYQDRMAERRFKRSEAKRQAKNYRPQGLLAWAVFIVSFTFHKIQLFARCG